MCEYFQSLQTYCANLIIYNVQFIQSTVAHGFLGIDGKWAESGTPPSGRS